MQPISSLPRPAVYPPVMPPAPPALPPAPPLAAMPAPTARQQGPAPRVAIAPEDWFWVQALREFAPVTAAVGMGAGVLIGLAAGTPALGAAWGACIVTGIPGVAIATERYVVPTVQRLLRGEGLGQTPLSDLSFAGGVLLPTAAVALGSALAVGTSALAFGGLLGALALVAGGRLLRQHQTG